LLPILLTIKYLTTLIINSCSSVQEHLMNLSSFQILIELIPSNWAKGFWLPSDLGSGIEMPHLPPCFTCSFVCRKEYLPISICNALSGEPAEICYSKDCPASGEFCSPFLYPHTHSNFHYFVFCIHHWNSPHYQQSVFLQVFPVLMVAVLLHYCNMVHYHLPFLFRGSLVIKIKQSKLIL